MVRRTFTSRKKNYCDAIAFSCMSISSTYRFDIDTRTILIEHTIKRKDDIVTTTQRYHYLQAFRSKDDISKWHGQNQSHHQIIFFKLNQDPSEHHQEEDTLPFAVNYQLRMSVFRTEYCWVFLSSGCTYKPLRSLYILLFQYSV